MKNIYHPHTAVVIGAGFAGLATASLLAAKGLNVTVLEKNSQAGGRAMVYENDGFRFDLGPSWYLMPEIFDKFFGVFDKKASDYYQIKRLDPSYRIFFGPDDYVDISSDLKANYSLFEKYEPGASVKLNEYLDIAKYQYEAAINEFLYKDYRTIFDFFTRKALVEGRKLHVFESIDCYAKRFFKNERLRRILEYSMVFLGGSPANTPAMYSLLSHVDFNLGVWYPMGGMGKVVDAFKQLAESLGVNFLFNQEVMQINVKDRKAVSLKTSDGEIDSDIVVVSADYAHSETELLDGKSCSYSSDYWQKRVMAPSAILIYLGLSSPIEGLRHHTLSFEYDWVNHFNSIFKDPGWPEKPSYYMCCPSKTDESVAPAGCENLVILVPVASGLEDDDLTREKFVDMTIDNIEKLLLQPIRSKIITKKIFSQRDFSEVFNSYKGTALGLSHTLMQTAIFRPSHRSKKVKNLYYTGQYTHPGIGLPMSLISAEIVSNIINKEQVVNG